MAGLELYYSNMAKFTNNHTKTGSISFNGQRVGFNGTLETSDKGLIEFLSARSNWTALDDKPTSDITAFKRRS